MSTEKTMADIIKDMIANLDAAGTLDDKLEGIIQADDATPDASKFSLWGRNDTGGDWDGVSRAIEIKITKP
jgi:hypothetical protein